uniref:Uncharacterized protein n=1 Tax=Amphora coffeiformis TaxID=265554 RepID=A0A7S3P418_9STRA
MNDDDDDDDDDTITSSASASASGRIVGHYHQQRMQDRRFYVAAFHRPPRLEQLQDALRLGANPNVDLLNFGATALDVASLTADVNLMRILLRAGAHVNHVGRDGFTALHRAVLTGNMAMATLLVTQAAGTTLDIDARTQGSSTAATTTTTTTTTTPLTALQIVFSRGGTPELAQLLIQQGGANVHVREAGGSGESLAHVARTPALLAVLQQHGVDLDEPSTQEGFTPLHYAALKGNLPTVQYLVLEAKARVHLRSRQGYSALHYAAHKGHLQVIQWLTEHGGADPRLADDCGNSAFHTACTVKQTAVVQYFMDTHGFQATDLACTGLTPLHFACLSTTSKRGAGSATNSANTTATDGEEVNDGTDLVRLLIGRQPALKKNAMTLLLLHLAADWSPGICRLLVQEHNFDLTCVHKERTVLHRAARQGTIDTVKCLTELLRTQNLSLDMRDAHGWTALHAAVAQRNVGKVQCLIHAGASVHVSDRHGRTPLHVAVRRVPLPKTESPPTNEEEEANGCDDYHCRSNPTQEPRPTQATTADATTRTTTTIQHPEQEKEWLCIIQLLLRGGADPTAPDKRGDMALAACDSASVLWEMMQTGPALRLFSPWSTPTNPTTSIDRKRPARQAAMVAQKRMKLCR